MSVSGPRTGGTPAVGRPGRRVLTDEPRTSAPFFASALDGAPRWAVGALTAVQAAVLSLLVLVLPSVAAFVATSADPSNDGVGWTRSVGVGARVWLLGHGVPVQVGGVAVSLVPLGVTALALFACYASARRSGVASRSGYAAGVLAYVVFALLVALLCGVPGGGFVRLTLGAAAVAALGLGAGLLRRPEAPSVRRLTRPLWVRVPAPVRVGTTAGVVGLALLLLAAALVSTLWVVAGRATVGDVVRDLAIDGIGGVVFAVAEVLYVPNLVVWALAWLAGPGFQVGAGTSFAPDAVVTAPLPAVPLLGALPGPDVVGPATVLAPMVVVVVGLLAGWYVHRRTVAGPWWSSVASVGTLAAVTGGGVAVLVTLASGSAGPGRLAQVGGQGWLVGLAAAAGVAAGALLTALPTDPAVRREVAARVRSALAARRGGPGGVERGVDGRSTDGRSADQRAADEPERAQERARLSSEPRQSSTS